MIYGMMRAIWRFLNLPVEDAALHGRAFYDVHIERRAIDAFLLLFPDDREVCTIGDWCDHCDDVHPVGYRCNRIIERWCEDCQSWVRATRHMRCPHDRLHSLDWMSRRGEFWQPVTATGRKRRYLYAVKDKKA